MHSLWTFLNGNAWLNLLFLVLAIVGIVLAIIFYYRSLKDKKLVFSHQTIQLVGRNLTSLKNIDIRYNNKIVERLSLTKLAIWNSGRDAIRSADFATTNPLIVTCAENNTIYDFQVSYQNANNKIEIKRSNEKLLMISFEFLNLNDGFVIEIYHSGNMSSDIIVQGTVIGGKQIKPGFRRGSLAEKANILGAPFNYMANRNSVASKLLAWFIIMPLTLATLISAGIVVAPIDLLNDKFLNKPPDEFALSHD